MTRLPDRARPWLALVGVVLSLAVAVPPVLSDARRYAFVQASQFVVFAVVTPALLALYRPPEPAGRYLLAIRMRRLAQHPDVRMRADRPGIRAAVTLVPFMALVTAWRLPPVLDALARDPVLTLAELVTLIGAGTAVWLALAGTLPRQQALPRPLRAAMAAFAMWTIWIIAYITGMSAAPLLRAGPGLTASALNAAADRQLAAAILWAVPAVCFVPMVYVVLMRWLGEREDPDHELRSGALQGSVLPSLNSPPRPPRGWRSR